MQEKAASKLDAIWKNGYKLATKAGQGKPEGPSENAASATG
jgi:hypothetical protein